MGNPLDLYGDLCSPDCSTCSRSGPCPLIPACMPESVTKLAVAWDGGYYESSYCGATVPCEQKTFAKPGKYRAKFCAAPGNLTKMNGLSQCSPSGPAQCSTVDFDYPSSATVTGSVGEGADGG